MIDLTRADLQHFERLLPWLLSRIELDPAFGSGPLATVIQNLLCIPFPRSFEPGRGK